MYVNYYSSQWGALSTIMKAHFIASTTNLKNDLESYRLILSCLKKHKVTLTSDWLDEAQQRTEGKLKNELDDTPWKRIIRDNLDAISKADIVVAEVGQKSFLVGFQVASALQMKKPILLLSRHTEVDSALGISNSEEIIQFAKYDKRSINTILADFLIDNRRGGKDIRFNFFITRKMLNYLNWASFQTGETKSEIIRKLLQREIDISDY